MTKLDNIIAGTCPNHVAPFLWVHGTESEEVLRGEVAAIDDAGIGALCVEARPHEDFNGPGWFRDLGIVLDECRSRGMGMWLLDDSHFPTGYADGEVARSHPELRKKFLRLQTFEFCGPMASAGASLGFLGIAPDDEVLAVLLQRRVGLGESDPAETLDVTDTLEWVDNFETGRPNTDLLGRELPGTKGACPRVRFDLPEGRWCLNVLTVSHHGGEKQTEGYLNPLVPEATCVLLDTVYQPVYDHFADEFGHTFKGFFSDEPRFGNIHGAEDASIGRNPSMPLPWCDGLLARLRDELVGTALEGLGAEALKARLPLLFAGDSDEAHVLRYAYMNLVSRLYSESFDGEIARWCHAHGCEHIGHTIEDDNAASRLGYGAGHIFRAMAHADMAGVDVVMHQLTPGFDDGLFKGFHRPGWDGEFFHYALAAFGVGLAHLDPAKRGRCLCELFGAFGWVEGNRLAKWLCDHMLVRGVNEFVPHAFDPAPFPDGDCPPHFRAHGHNPQYPEFAQLMGYLNRTAELLSGGVARVDAAVLFHAEAEWSGSYMEVQKPGAVLARGQVTYDIVSCDFLEIAEAECDAPPAEGGRARLVINGMRYGALVVPEAEALPAATLTRIAAVAEAGVPVVFVGSLPARASEGVDVAGPLGVLAHIAEVVSLEGLAGRLRELGIAGVVADAPQPWLRCARVSHEWGDVFLFTNEGPAGRVQTRLSVFDLDVAGAHTYAFDAFSDELREDADPFALDIPAYGSKLVVVTREMVAGALPAREPFVVREELALGACSVALAPMETCCREWGEPFALESPGYVSSLPGRAAFAGRIRYEFDVSLSGGQATSRARLVLEGVREGASVTVNDVPCGTRICGDYVFDVSGTLKEGRNLVTVELNTTLGRAMDDFASQYVPIEPTGMAGARLQFG